MSSQATLRNLSRRRCRDTSCGATSKKFRSWCRSCTSQIWLGLEHYQPSGCGAARRRLNHRHTVLGMPPGLGFSVVSTDRASDRLHYYHSRSIHGSGSESTLDWSTADAVEARAMAAAAAAAAAATTQRIQECGNCTLCWCSTRRKASCSHNARTDTEGWGSVTNTPLA
jgi:hypothetical protein